MRTLAAFLLALLLTPALEAVACSCIPPPPPEEALEEAAAVFVGEVVEHRTVESNAIGDRYEVTFRVLRTWKGVEAAEVAVYTATNSAACGYHFEKGKTYLVYAHEYEGELGTGICSRTTSLEAAEDDLRELGGGTFVAEPNPNGNLRGGRCGGPTAPAAAQTLVFTLVGLALLRRRRP